MLELLMDLILRSCWIWVKFVVDRGLKEACWRKELVRGWSNVMYETPALAWARHIQPSLVFPPSQVV